jgi:hypothetical protein
MKRLATSEVISRSKRHLSPLAVIALFVFASNWQLIRHINSGFIGRPFEDAISVMWEFWWGLQVFLGETTSIFFTPDVYFPNGYYLAADAQPIWWMILFSPITYLLGPLLTYNLLLLLVLFAAGTGVYLLVEQLTQQRWSGVISAAIYMTAPLVTIRLAGHFNILLGLAFLPYLALFWYLALIAEERKKAVLFAVFSGIMYALASLSSWYFVFIGFLVIGCLFLFPTKPTLIRDKLRLLTVTLVTWLVIATPFLLLTFKANQGLYGETAAFSIAGNDGQSISLHRLFVPNRLNSIWGVWSAEQFPRGFEETLVSLNYVALTLGIIGFWKGEKRFRRPFGLLILLSTLLAMGTTLHWNDQRIVLRLPGVLATWYQGVTGWLTAEITDEPAIPLPGLLLAKYLPFYASMRAWSRFMLPAILGLAILGGIGAKYILSTFKKGWIIVVLALVLIFIEGLAVPYENFSQAADIHRPVDDWLKEQEPGSALIEYPWPHLSKRALYSQSIHGQPIVNGYAPHFPLFLNENPAVVRTWPDAESVAILDSWGIRYILATGPNNDEFNIGAVAEIKALPMLCQVITLPAGALPDEAIVHVFEIVGPGEPCRD